MLDNGSPDVDVDRLMSLSVERNSPGFAGNCIQVG